MLELDKKFLAELEGTWVQKLKVFLYEAGCSGMKVSVETEFEVTDELVELPPPNLPLSWEEWSFSPPVREGLGEGIKIYTPKTDLIHLQNGRITRIIKADHTGQEKVRYIFTSEEIQDRCGCGTSFAFEKKKPKIDLEKLRAMRENFKK